WAEVGQVVRMTQGDASGAVRAGVTRLHMVEFQAPIKGQTPWSDAAEKGQGVRAGGAQALIAPQGQSIELPGRVERAVTVQVADTGGRKALPDAVQVNRFALLRCGAAGLGQGCPLQ